MAVKFQINTGGEDDTLPNGHPIREYYQKSDSGDEEENTVQLDQLAAHITNQWEINKRDKHRVEQEMLNLQKAVNCEYDETTLQAIKKQGGSEVFVPLTSMQCNAGASWLLSVLSPPGDKAFSFKPTPIPELPTALQNKIIAQVQQTLATGAPQAEGLPVGPDGAPLTPESVQEIADVESKDVVKQIRKESVKRAERMERLVKDQLLQSKWDDALQEFITDLTTFHTAFIKTSYEYKKKMVVTSEGGQMSMHAEEELVAKDERVSPFDIYPSPDQTCIHDGSMIERLKLSKDAIYACLDKPGYDNDKILSVLEEVDTRGFADWQSNVDSQRRYSENHSADFSGQDGSIYGLRFLGPVTVEKLMDWGYSVETLQEYGLLSEKEAQGGLSRRILLKVVEIDAILIGHHVIKAVPNTDIEKKRQYYAASYRKVPGSFWGKSIAMLSQPHQRMVNAAARALSNNMGIASGPQIVVFVDRLPNGESLQSIRPLKIWQMTSDERGANQKPIEFFQPESNAKELMAVYQYYFDSVGDVTGIPKAAYATDPTRSMPGANTASGLAMILETASKQIKQAVRNIDTGIIEPRLYYQYRTNMMNKDVPNRFKGDMQIQAFGAKSVAAKAVENQRNIELLQATANPLDAQLLGEAGRAKLLRAIARSYDIDDLVPTEDELEERAAMAAEQPPEPSPEMVKLEIEKLRSEVRIKDQELENKNAEAQRQLDLQIAQLEYQSKQLELQIAQVQNQENNKAKLQEIALKEKNANARFKAEVTLKEQGKTGV